MKINFVAILFFCVGFSARCQQTASAPLLERTITISFQHEQLDVALKKISQQGGFIFSYNPSMLDNQAPVSGNFVNKTIREILDALLKGIIQYKVKGKYIILTKVEISGYDPGARLYSGYIVDEATGERLKDVSVYDPVSLSSAVTDSYGYFEIELNKPQADLRLAINKKNYSDTIIAVPSGSERLLNIPIRVNKEKLNSFADSVGRKLSRFWQNTRAFTRQRANISNIDDTLYRAFQFSIVPFAGTNRALSGNVINDFSLNLLGGYALGLRKLEFGGLFNLERGSVQGVQIAGLFNGVAGDLAGVQLAGIFNANGGETSGAQLAGVYNLNRGAVIFFSAAGVFNFARRGSQAVQLAGVSNVTIGDQGREHIAGVFNFSTANAVSQIAGVFNFSPRQVKGVQVAGVLNFAGRQLDGVQLSGVLNYATRVHGSQIGFINIADSVRGLQIGFLSFTLKGYHKIEVSADEVFYTNLAFRTGTPKFYNILTAGAKPGTFKNSQTCWTFGYGIGTAPKLSRKIFLNLDLTSNQVVQGNSIDAIHLINKLYAGVDVQVLKRASLTFGVTLNARIISTTHEGYWDIFTDFRPHFFYDRSYSNDTNMKMWTGGKIGIRFL